MLEFYGLLTSYQKFQSGNLCNQVPLSYLLSISLNNFGNLKLSK